MAIVSIDTRDRTPIYAQLERGLRAAIATGRLRPGDQLPTVRQLAVDLSVNANTVARVYAELERAGVLERPRSCRTRSSNRAVNKRTHMVSIALGRRSDESTGGGHRFNVVAIAIL